MIDVLRHEINIPQEGKSFRNIPQKRKFFRSFGEIYKLYEKQSACKKIEGVFLADNFHPMIQEKQEIENATNLRIEKVLQSPIDKDGGYITFEFTCKNKLLLRERTDSRSANCTSIDALVYVQTTDGRKILIPIEWKYTERYEKKKVDDKTVQNRHQTVKNRYLGLVDEESNLKEWPEEFYWDPLYEFARQTLLVEQIIAQKPTCGTTTIEADDYVHLIVRPNENKDIISDIQRFRNEMCLKNLNKVIDIDSKKLLSPLEGNTNYKELLDYLETRYWQSK